MTSSWSSLTCVALVVVVLSISDECSALDHDARRASLERVLVRLCTAILARQDNDVAEKREWGENTMTAWGKRDAVGDAVTVCAMLKHGRRFRDESSMPAASGNRIDRRTRWVENVWKPVAGDDQATKRSWGENSMDAWGKREWGENNMDSWGKRN